MNFCSFVRNFESHVDERVDGDAQKLSYCSIVKVMHANSLKAVLECNRREATVKPADCCSSNMVSPILSPMRA